MFTKKIINHRFRFGQWIQKKPMTAAYLPSILVPLVGLVFPAIAMTSLFMYIEKQEVN